MSLSRENPTWNCFLSCVVEITWKINFIISKFLRRKKTLISFPKISNNKSPSIQTQKQKKMWKRKGKEKLDTSNIYFFTYKILKQYTLKTNLGTVLLLRF